MNEWQLFKKDCWKFWLTVKYWLQGDTPEQAAYNAEILVNGWKGKVKTYSKSDEED